MYFNQKVNNALLNGAIETMKADYTSRTRNLVMEEIMKAHFLCPAAVSIPPVPGEDGRLELQDGCEIMQKMVVDSKDRPLLLAFTSEEQMELWKEKSGMGQNCYAFASSFLEYADMMLQKLPDGSYGPAQGFVIDPYGVNMIIDRDMVANLIVRLQMRGDN